MTVASRLFGATTGAVAPLTRFRSARAVQRAFTAAHAGLYRRFGLIRRIGDAPILLLTTTGRRSGRQRTVPVMYVPGGDPVLVASNGGTKGHPSWFLNLREDPEVWIEIGGRRTAARARITNGEERARLWGEAVSIYPSYASYQRKTERELPVVVLEDARSQARA